MEGGEEGDLLRNVSQRRPDPSRLDAVDITPSQYPGQQRVFGETLEIPPAQRVTVQVDCGTEQDVCALGYAFSTQLKADRMGEVFVERGCQTRCAGVRVGRGAVEEPCNAMSRKHRRPGSIHNELSRRGGNISHVQDDTKGLTGRPGLHSDRLTFGRQGYHAQARRGSTRSPCKQNAIPAIVSCCRFGTSVSMAVILARRTLPLRRETFSSCYHL